MTTEELIIKVQEWAHERNIIKGCPAIKQAYKTLEECGELIEAVGQLRTVKDLEFNYDLKSPIEMEVIRAKRMVMDAVGDITVTLIIQCAMQGIDFTQCLEMAYEVIKNRKGKLIGGKFVKDEK